MGVDLHGFPVGMWRTFGSADGTCLTIPICVGLFNVVHLTRVLNAYTLLID